MKATLGDLRNQVDVSPLGIQACSSAFVQLANESIQRLMMGENRWWDLQFKMCVVPTGNVITWPRGVASIESAAICGAPIYVRSGWYEFLESGYGLRGACNSCCDNQLFDRGTAVTFRDIRHGYTIKLVTQEVEAAGLEMGFLGYDCEGNWIRTQDGSGWRDGVWVPIPTDPNAPYTGQVQFALGGIQAIIKPTTASLVHLYDYNVSTGDSQKIGVYEWDETRPVYRRSLVGGLPTNNTSPLTIMYRQEWKPVVNDNDFLQIANIPALSEMMLAVKLYRQNQMQLASGHEAKAYQILDREVSHYIGNGVVEPLRIDFKSFGAGGIPVVY